MKKYRFKIAITAIVVGTNLSVLLLDTRIDAAIFTMISFGVIAYVFTFKAKG